MDPVKAWEFVATRGTELGLKLLAALALWIAGRWIIALVVRLVQRALARKNVDATLARYLGTIIAVILNITLVVGILGFFGVETTSFAALLAGLGLAIGTAWGGLLAHFAAGAFLLVLRPFKVGDFVTAGGVTGTVKEIGLFVTTLVTPDNVQTFVGNNKLFSDTIQNFSTLSVRRVDRTAQLANGVDVGDAVRRFRAAVERIPNVAKAPAPDVTLLDFNPAGTVIAVRPYTHTDHYWQVYCDTNEAIAAVCREAGYPVPAPTQIFRQQS
jgi:small conductance mechanosensitive channel